MLVDPQLYNRYAYVRNNPLRFVDPKGEKIELLGSEEERRKALELLRQAVGEEAGSYVYQRTRTDKEGGLYYTVEIMEKAPNLLRMNGVAAAVARLISTDNLATIEFAQPGTKVLGLPIWRQTIRRSTQT